MSLLPCLDHIKGTGNYGSQCSSRVAQHYSSPGVRVPVSIVSVHLYKYFTRSEEDHIEGDITIQSWGEPKVQSSQTSFPDDSCECLLPDVSKHHGSLWWTTCTRHKSEMFSSNNNNKHLPMIVVAAPAAAPAASHFKIPGSSKFRSMNLPTMIQPCILKAFSGMMPNVRDTRPEQENIDHSSSDGDGRKWLGQELTTLPKTIRIGNKPTNCQ